MSTFVVASSVTRSHTSATMTTMLQYASINVCSLSPNQQGRRTRSCSPSTIAERKKSWKPAMRILALNLLWIAFAIQCNTTTLFTTHNVAPTKNDAKVHVVYFTV